MKKGSHLKVLIYFPLALIIVLLGIYRIKEEFSLPRQYGEGLNRAKPKHEMDEYKSYLLNLRKDLYFEDWDYDLILYPENQAYAAIVIPKSRLDQFMDKEMTNSDRYNLYGILNSLTYSSFFHNKLDPIFSSTIGDETQYKFHIIFSHSATLESEIVDNNEKSIMNSVLSENNFAVFISLLIDKKTLAPTINTEELYNSLFLEIKEMFGELPHCYFSLSAATTDKLEEYRYTDFVKGLFEDENSDFYESIWKKP
ncbi:hypothetical protein [Holdemania massiliensis]|uniref:Uncharacterized protein n=2 Tax=Holdemania massiliensis TaxID=1468449 RepID=A0A6N7S5E3_9FIRM|nr:hypothetical protein [Holdemania massiliensis]MSA70039.1 hypothetical protein [Holdemania massiliensis]MSA88718.1 hypothetical protein [Holdemania massiliensis]MSB77339.1 hypothetical protein [Holdemania massiliensis]MSC32265.1 hypothetical protein [Holdemania massiliensis]MSC38585.1 hypothetical protein [Holdemania massiliensis]